MMNTHLQRQPAANVLSYPTFAPPRGGRAAAPSSSSMFTAPYPGMQMHMYAQPEYAPFVLQQQTQQHQHHQHHLQHQQQLHPHPHPLLQQQHQHPAYLNQSFRRVDNLNPLIHRSSRGSQQQHQLRHYHNMAYTPQMNEDEFAEMQKLSEGWEPEVKGPLVGARQTSAAITEEYASADPIYQQKTTALPKTFSHYRTVRGDGRCGWRAIGFAFLEKLILSNDVNKLYEQEARLRSLSNVIDQAGYAPMVYEDFADELFEFMRTLGDAVRAGKAESVLLDGFNQEGIQSAIITHLRTLTASWMKTRPEEYMNYIPDLSIARYVDEYILPYGAEIDHPGLSALNDVLLAPAGIGLEVLCLDLTPGPEANLHNFTRSDHLGYTDSCVRLLYRPGHYDVLYKIEDIPAPPIATYLQLSSQPYNEPVFDLPVSDFMTLVPGMSMTNRQHGWSSNTYGGGGVCDFFPAPTPAQPCPSQISTPAPPTSLATILPQPSSSYTQHQPALVLPPDHLPPQELAIRPAAHNRFTQLCSPFRPSVWVLEPEVAQVTSHLPLQTSIFRNSHFNTAHFLNPDFQPEEWTPDSDCVTTKAAKHKPSG